MQSISDLRGDVVELPLAQYDSSCSIEHVLQRLEIGRTRTVKNTVTVVTRLATKACTMVMAASSVRDFRTVFIFILQFFDFQDGGRRHLVFSNL